MTPGQHKQYLDAWAGSTWLRDRVPAFIVEPADREDIAHRGWCRLATVDPSKIEEADAFPAFAIKTLRRIAINLAERNSKHVELTNEVIDDLQESVIAIGQDKTSPEEECERQQRKTLVRQALLELPRRRRQYFYLAKIEGFPLEEIAWRMGVSPKTVKKELALAMVQFRAVLKRLMGETDPRRGEP